MKTFPRNRSTESNISFFSDVARVINKHKGFSISSTLSTSQFLKYFDGLQATEGKEKGKHVMGVYGMCFLLSVVMNKLVCEQVGSKQRTPFVMDTGNNYKHHVVEAYEEIVRMQNLDEWNMGSLIFTTDSLNALQAADVIAWSARRRTNSRRSR